MPALLAREPSALAHAVRRSCEIKAAVVAADERENGLRAILNFGHTTAHAIEAVCGYGEWLHGEAVGAGMVVAARISAARGSLDAEHVARLTRLVAAAGLPTTLPQVSLDSLLEAMRHDKKSVAGELRFILLHGLGRARLETVPAGAVLAALDSAVSASRLSNRSNS